MVGSNATVHFIFFYVSTPGAGRVCDVCYRTAEAGTGQLTTSGYFGGAGGHARFLNVDVRGGARDAELIVIVHHVLVATTTIFFLIAIQEFFSLLSGETRVRFWCAWADESGESSRTRNKPRSTDFSL